MSIESGWWGGEEVGEAAKPSGGITASEVGVASTGIRPKQNSAKISQSLPNY
jgi:hypothetical protein